VIGRILAPAEISCIYDVKFEHVYSRKQAKMAEIELPLLMHAFNAVLNTSLALTVR
jgi:hypothetical protein